MMGREENWRDIKYGVQIDDISCVKNTNSQNFIDALLI